LAPTPRQKTADISPIFKADKVTLHVSREKDEPRAIAEMLRGRSRTLFRPLLLLPAE